MTAAFDGRLRRHLLARVLHPTLVVVLLAAVGCDNADRQGDDSHRADGRGPGDGGLDGRLADAIADDVGCSGCMDAWPRLDDRIPDVDPDDAAHNDADPSDVMPVDAEIDVAGPSDAGVPDLYPFDPDPICAQRTQMEMEMLDSFELIPSVPGIIVGVSDVDDDGRTEAYVFTQSDFDESPIEDLARSTYATIFEVDEGGDFVEQGQVVGFSPFAPIDLGEPWGVGLVGPDAFVDELTQSYRVTLGVRADVPGSDFRFDTTVRLFAHLDLRGELQADYFAPFDVEVFDGDADGHPEILTFNGDLIEWRGDHFEVVWRVAEADPRDEVREVGGGAFGRVTHGDFDGDGLMEFVVAGTGGQGPIGGGNIVGTQLHARVFENTGDDRYRLVARLPFGANNAQFASVGDLNGDGRPDFLYGGSPGGCIRLEVWSAAGVDTFTRLARVDHAASMGDPPGRGISAFADLNGDGDDELVINVADAVVAWDWDRESEQLRQILGYPLCQDCNWSPLWTGDLDGDGAEEIMFSERTHEEARAGLILSPTGFRILRRVPPAPPD